MPLDVGDKNKSSDQEDTINQGISGSRFVVDMAARAGSQLKGTSGHGGMLGLNESAVNEHLNVNGEKSSPQGRQDTINNGWSHKEAAMHTAPVDNSIHEYGDGYQDELSSDNKETYNTKTQAIDNANKNILFSDNANTLNREQNTGMNLQASLQGERLESETGRKVLNDAGWKGKPQKADDQRNYSRGRMIAAKIREQNNNAYSGETPLNSAGDNVLRTGKEGAALNVSQPSALLKNEHASMENGEQPDHHKNGNNPNDRPQLLQAGQGNSILHEGKQDRTLTQQGYSSRLRTESQGSRLHNEKDGNILHSIEKESSSGGPVLRNRENGAELNVTPNSALLKSIPSSMAEESEPRTSDDGKKQHRQEVQVSQGNSTLHASRQEQTLRRQGNRNRLQNGVQGSRLRYGKKGDALHGSQSARLVIDKAGKDYTGRRAITPDKYTGRVTLNANRMAKTDKKLQKVVRKQYRKDYRIKGGIVSPLRVETGFKSKLRTSPLVSLESKAEQGMSGLLHYTNNISDQDSFGTQKALFDVSDRGVTAVTGIFRVSRQAKDFRLRRNEKKIAKLRKREDRIAKAAFKNEYKAAYKRFKESSVGKNSSFLLKQKQKRFLKRKYMKNALRQYQNAKKSGSAAKVSFNTGLSLTDKARNLLASAASFVRQTKIWIPVAAVAVFFMIPSILTGIFTIVLAPFMGDETTAGQTRGTGYPTEVENWREFVTDRCNFYKEEGDCDLSLFVNAIMATIQQESGGVSSTCGGDIMQCKACGNWESGTPQNWSSFTEEQKSIDAGVRYFYTGMKSWGVTKPDDYDGLQMVAQGYNYGYGFFEYARSQSAVKWTLPLSKAYAASKGGNYGHPPYGEEWLTKYMNGMNSGNGAIDATKGVSGVLNTALNQEGITEIDGDNNVFYNTEYYGHEVHGSDYPWCCVFVWWCFEKSGNVAAFNNGEKTAGCSTVMTWANTNNLSQANMTNAVAGDLVIFRNGQHIGIVVENKGGGNLVTIEGNTSPEAGSGNDYNGGCVAKRMRNIFTDGITQVITPQWDKVK